MPDGCSTIKEAVYQTQISSGIFIGINGEKLDDFVINYNDGGKILYVLLKILIATLGQLYYEKCNTEF